MHAANTCIHGLEFNSETALVQTYIYTLYMCVYIEIREVSLSGQQSRVTQPRGHSLPPENAMLHGRLYRPEGHYCLLTGQLMSNGSLRSFNSINHPLFDILSRNICVG